MTILCTIDLETREVSLPAGQVIASYDHNVDVIRFQAETIPGFSLNTSSIRIAAQGPNKARHDYAVDPSTVSIEEETGYITFDWPIPAGVTEMPIGAGFKYGDKGQLIFAVCAEIIDGSTVSKAWHSDDGIITVVAHLEPEAGGGEDPSETATNAQKIGQLQTDVAVIRTEVGALANGSPAPVETIAEMTDESAVYLYTGSETGYTAGNWYYYDGTAWTSGGTYGGAVTDTTLSISGAAADAKATGDAVADLKSAFSLTNAFVFPSPSFVNNRNMAGITYTRVGYDTYHVAGTATGLTFDNLFETANGVLPNGNSLADCDYLFVKVSVTGSQISKDTVYVEMMKKDSSHSSYYGTINIKEDTALPVASKGYTDILFRVRVVDGATVDGNIVVQITDRVDNYKTTLEKNIMSFKGGLPVNTDLNNVDETGIWILSSNKGFVNLPFKSSSFGLLYSTASNDDNVIVQVAVASSATDNATVWKRQCLRGTWSEWQTTIIDDYLVKTNTRGVGQLGILDLNEMLGNNVYLLSDSYTFVNKPQGMTVGFLAVFFTGNWHLQLAWAFNGQRMWKRRGNAQGTEWEDWQEISGTSVVNNYANEYSFPEYSQTVNLTSSPQITADTNNYLAPSGDSTDRTAEILAMLTSNGICRLGAGDYYVSGLQMPDDSSIIGSGAATHIILSGNTDGFAIKPGSYCTLSDFTLKGALTIPTFGENIGGRHGILWQGTYTENQRAPYLLRLNNIYISNFTGGGITCYDTGYGIANGIEATNIIVKSCWAGLNISYWSEFHKFTNVRCWLCRIGCVNNGGNNIFVNCDFSGSLEIAMLMDNSTGQSPNNSHGSCVGCVFNHTSSNGSANAGVGIDILNCGDGFIFSGCQIFYSKIHLEDSPGIVFANCNFGYSNCDIEVSGGKGILFSGNIHQNKPPITISNGAEVHFVNCYNRTTGAVVEP